MLQYIGIGLVFAMFMVMVGNVAIYGVPEKVKKEANEDEAEAATKCGDQEGDSDRKEEYILTETTDEENILSYRRTVSNNEEVMDQNDDDKITAAEALTEDLEDQETR